ncbi:MAG: L-lactate dehydrogenase [Gammaproteobacteria bacterium]|jgi:L-lactate dehydrogenase
MNTLKRHTVGVVGTGQVGMAAAYAMFQQRAVNELIFIDADTKRAEGEAMDLMHGQGYVGRRRVRAGSFADLVEAQVIVISAGVGQKPGESRLQLLSRNAEIFRELAAQLDRYAPDAILLIATNPVDILTYLMQEYSNRSGDLIIGTGTMLDTTRFRSLLAEYYNVDPRSVHAFIIGEHGDSEVPVWSTANIAGVQLLDNAVLGKPFDRDAMAEIFQKVRHAAYQIIDRKGYTNWAIGLVIAHLLRTIQDDQNSLLPVSVRLRGEYGIKDVCLSIPTAVGINGVGYRALPALQAEELAALRHSAEVLRRTLSDLTSGK